MCCPRPLRSRSLSAASTATVAYMPLIRSATATPALSGPPPGSPSAWPVTLISPPMAWIRKS